MCVCARLSEFLHECVCTCRFVDTFLCLLNVTDGKTGQNNANSS